MDFNINVNSNSSRLNDHHLELEVKIEELQLEDIDFTLCCRLCIQNNGSIKFLTSKTLCELIKMFTNIDLEYKAENYPKLICENCNQLLNDFHVYQQNCLQINQRLTDLLISKNENKTSLASTHLENMKLNNNKWNEKEPEPIQIDTEQKFNFILMEYGESHSKFNDILKDNEEISSDNVLKLLLNDKDLRTIEDNENDIEEYEIEYLDYSDLEENDKTRSAGDDYDIEVDEEEGENIKSDNVDEKQKKKKKKIMIIDSNSKSDNDNDNERIEDRACKDIHYYICPECNKFYTQKRSLKRHVLSAHPEKADCWRPVKAFKSCLCIEGRKGFHDKYELKAETASSVCDVAQLTTNGNDNEYHEYHKKQQNNIGAGYVCTECGNTYTEIRSLKRHAISKHPDVPDIWKQAKISLMAKRCRQSIQENRRRPQHLDEMFYCSDCGNTYLYFRSLRRHAIQCHGTKLTASDSEKMKLKLVDKDNNNKVDEDSNNKIQLYDCKLCGRILYEKRYLKRHLQLKHPDAALNDYYYNYNEMIIIDNDNDNDDDDIKSQSNHNSTSAVVGLAPAPKYTCNIDKNCNATFSNKENYQRHKSKEHNFKEYLCYTCGKAFTNIKNLESHETFHLNIMPYACMKCDQRFRFTANLKTHFKKHHEGHRYYCTRCGKAFLSNCTRKRHELIHDGIKDFKCDQCVAEFYTLKELKCHQRYHNDIRPHFCNICYKSFVAKTVLRIHMRSHTGEKPFQCHLNQCNKSFAEKTKLYRHQRNVHHVNPITK